MAITLGISGVLNFGDAKGAIVDRSPPRALEPVLMTRFGSTDVSLY
jgi:hypothetical protein